MSDRGRLYSYVAVGLVVVALIFIIGPTGQGGAFDPRGTSPVGLGVLSAAVEDLGGQVRIEAGAPRDTGAVAVVVPGAVGGRTVNEMSQFVEDGGRLVLLDPTSPLNPVPIVDLLSTDLVADHLADARCPLFDGVAEQVESNRWYAMGAAAGTDGSSVPDAPSVSVEANCYPVGSGHGVVVATVGRGEVVIVGGATAFLNVNITKADNAQLALAVLAPTGTETIVYVTDRPGEGDKTLLDVIPDRAKRAFWILVAGVALGVLGHARRLGPVIDEPLAVQIPGSELALAIGEQMARYGHVEVAARRLRDDLRREVRVALSLPLASAVDDVVQIAIDRLGSASPPRVQGDVRLALGQGEVATEDQLVELARACASVRRELQRGGQRATAADPGQVIGPRVSNTPSNEEDL